VIVGVDEVGRGPLAGPVVAAAVILCPGGIHGLADSKVLKPAARTALAAEINARCLVGIGSASVAEIDERNILQATMLAMMRAVSALGVSPREILVDGNRCPDWRWPSRAIVGGDGLEPCISAASIVAKVWRDSYMAELHHEFPHYGWDSNVGYGTPAHRTALDQYGPTPHHRRSFAPVARHFAAI